MLLNKTKIPGNLISKTILQLNFKINKNTNDTFPDDVCICGLFTGSIHLQKFKLPGKGLKQHDFVYYSEWDMRKPKTQSIFVARDGKVVWQYSIPLRTATGGVQEFYDVTMLPNGNIVYTCMSCAGIISPEKIYGNLSFHREPKPIPANPLGKTVF